MSRLRAVPVVEAERYAFATADRIAGYPMDSPPHTVPASDLSGSLELLSRDDGYLFGAATRCRNSKFVGIRFVTSVRVELAIGLPCNQAIWSFQNEGKTLRWGAALSGPASKAVRVLFDSALK